MPLRLGLWMDLNLLNNFNRCLCLQKGCRFLSKLTCGQGEQLAIVCCFPPGPGHPAHHTNTTKWTNEPPVYLINPESRLRFQTDRYFINFVQNYGRHGNQFSKPIVWFVNNIFRGPWLFHIPNINALTVALSAKRFYYPWCFCREPLDYVIKQRFGIVIL